MLLLAALSALQIVATIVLGVLLLHRMGAEGEASRAVLTTLAETVEHSVLRSEEAATAARRADAGVDVANWHLRSLHTKAGELVEAERKSSPRPPRPSDSGFRASSRSAPDHDELDPQPGAPRPQRGHG